MVKSCSYSCFVSAIKPPFVICSFPSWSTASRCEVAWWRARLEGLGRRPREGSLRKLRSRPFESTPRLKNSLLGIVSEPDYTHHRVKEHRTDGLQLNRIGFDQTRKYIICRQATESEPVKLETSCTVILSPTVIVLCPSRITIMQRQFTVEVSSLPFVRSELNVNIIINQKQPQTV